MQGVQVQSLVREQRSHMPCGRAPQNGGGAWLGTCNQSLSKVLTIPEAGWGQGHEDSLKSEINKSKDMNLIKKP